jgi:hypothetical protein
MDPRKQDEYRALRTTIRQRGTARVWVFVAGTAAWAALTVSVAALPSPPVATLLPLLVLAAAFEGVFALHVGVERVGRYIQVFFEEDGRGWEHAAMAFGRPRASATTDALFTVPFLLAALFNMAPALIAQPTGPELVFVGGAHALFVLRLVVARVAASKQRAIDLARFEELRTQETPSPPGRSGGL